MKKTAKIPPSATSQQQPIRYQPQAQYQNQAPPLRQPVQQSSVTTAPLQQPVQLPQQGTKNDEEASLGCAILIGLVSLIPYCGFLIVIAMIFVGFNVLGHLFKLEIRKAWNNFWGFLILYGICFLIAKGIEMALGFSG